MFNRLFPRQIDNQFEGHWLAVWLLAPIVVVRTVIGFNSMAFSRSIATSADAIPLEKFGADGAEAVISLFALLGLFILLFSLLGAIVLVRYRAMIPFMYLMLLIQQLGSKALLLIHPVVRSGSASIGSAVVLAILAMTVVGFVLSLIGNSKSPTR